MYVLDFFLYVLTIVGVPGWTCSCSIGIARHAVIVAVVAIAVTGTHGE